MFVLRGSYEGGGGGGGEMYLLYVYGILRCPHLVRSQRFIWGGDNGF